MGAPSATARQTPTDAMFEEGYQSLITFEDAPALDFWEKVVGNPSVDGGESIEVTTQHNEVVRTKAFRQLIDLEEFTVTCAYGGGAYIDALNQVNRNQVLTRTWPDGTTMAFWGGMRKVEFADHTPGEHPECTLTITPTNRDNDGAEQLPVVVEVTGT